MGFLITHILVSYAAGMLLAVSALVTKRQGLFFTATLAMVIGFGLHTADLAAQIFREGFMPLYGAREVCSFLSWALVLYFLGVQLSHPTKALAGLLFPTATALMLISILAPSGTTPPAAVYDDPFLFSLHAGLVLLAYAAFFTMFMAAVLYIIQEREIKGKHFSAIFHRLPSLNTCDSIGFGALTIGFVLLTAGITSGFVWSHHRDGLIWHGQPIEIFAVSTWLVYFFLIHYRLTAGWRGRRAAIVAILGFFLVVVSLAVLRYSSGFHELTIR